MRVDAHAAAVLCCAGAAVYLTQMPMTGMRAEAACLRPSLAAALVLRNVSRTMLARTVGVRVRHYCRHCRRGCLLFSMHLVALLLLLWCVAAAGAPLDCVLFLRALCRV
jgi:hypothetical protein